MTSQTNVNRLEEIECLYLRPIPIKQHTNTVIKFDLEATEEFLVRHSKSARRVAGA